LNASFNDFNSFKHKLNFMQLAVFGSWVNFSILKDFMYFYWKQQIQWLRKLFCCVKWIWAFPLH